MNVQDELSYHSERAERELGLGLLSRCMRAARAHLELASLHAQRVRALQAATPQPRPPLTLN